MQKHSTILLLWWFQLWVFWDGTLDLSAVPELVNIVLSSVLILAYSKFTISLCKKQLRKLK